MTNNGISNVRIFSACISMVKDTIALSVPTSFPHICGGCFCKQIIIFRYYAKHVIYTKPNRA